jgi:hypothetical protein
MIARQTFAVWAPQESPWSAWAKPSLFAELTRVTSELPDIGGLAEEEAPWLPVFDRRTAVVLDLPGAVAIHRGLQLARRGYRPVPLFNTSSEGKAVVETWDILRGYNLGRRVLAELRLEADAPPVFLLDSNRLAGSGGGVPGMYDNRWVVLPQDFPSAAKLKEHGVAAVLLWQARTGQPADDLAHVLRRWQDGGLSVYLESGTLESAPTPLTVYRPSRYKSIFHRLFVLAGLRRNSAGGFGAVVPEPSQGGGGGFG